MTEDHGRGAQNLIVDYDINGLNKQVNAVQKEIGLKRKVRIQ